MRMNRNQGPSGFLTNYLKSNRTNSRRRRPLDDSKFILILPAIGGVLLLVGAFLPSVGILPVFGIFLILIWSVLNSRTSREKFFVLRAEYVAAWRSEKKVAVDMKKVYRYTFFCLLPLYCMLALPAILAVGIGEMMAWLMLGASFTIISAVAMHSFSTIWKDLYIKLWRFWLMQLVIFVAINGTVALIYLLL